MDDDGKPATTIVDSESEWQVDTFGDRIECRGCGHSMDVYWEYGA